VPFQPPRRDRILTPDAAALHHAPTRRFQVGINVLGAGFALRSW
jgi:hypothetical protein